MPEHTPGQISNKARLSLYFRMVLGTGVLGIVLGYYLQIVGQVNMTPFQVFAFCVRGFIVGALVWTFELFGMIGKTGNRLAKLSPPARFALRIGIYLVLGEAGFWIGAAIFEPHDVIDLFQTANGPP